MHSQIQTTTLKLLQYCRDNDWAGYDPYDALNSRLLSRIPFLNSRIPRIALTQALKRSPVNIRPILAIPKLQNPKALGLFLTSLLNLSRLGMLDREDEIDSLVTKIAEKRSPGVPYSCWGYSFPWQTRKMVVPAAYPNLVCTVFVANSLLDAYEQRGNTLAFEMAANAAEYIRKELYWEDGDTAAFSYPLPDVRVLVHNANFLAAALLCRMYRLNGDSAFLQPALRATRTAVAAQHEDGSWHYGTEKTQRWIDNFHTGYNLCSLQSVAKDANTAEFDQSIRSGFDFYIRHFFREDGAPRYFHNRTYPIDIHCVAQSVITLLEFSDLNAEAVPLANKVLGWTMQHMWDERGFFYYRVLRALTVRTPYMRWSEAWMLLALTTYLTHASASIDALAATEIKHA